MSGYDDSFYDDDYLAEREQRRAARRQSGQQPAAGSQQRAMGYVAQTDVSHVRRSATAQQRNGVQPGQARRNSSARSSASATRRTTGQQRSHMRQDAPQMQARQLQRRRSPLPFILLAVVLVALLVFLATRIVSCNRKPGSTAPTGGAGSTELIEGGGVVAEPEPAETRINVLMVGDMLVHHGIWESGEKEDGTRDFNHLFAHVLSEVQWADIAMIDQETPLAGGTNFDFTGFPVFNGPQEIGDAEVNAGFNVILHATNHSMDQGYDGITSELNFWRTNHPEVQVVGEVMPYTERANDAGPIYYEKDGFKVAIVTSTYDLNGYADPENAVVITDYDQIAKDVALAEANADLTIYCPHWGNENETYPSDAQIEMARYLVDLGVDVIIGNHPHIIQPVSFVQGDSGNTAPVYWSVGNFISTMDTDANLIGGAAKLVLVKDASGARVESAQFVPHVAHRALTVSSYGINDLSDEPSYNPDMTTYLLSDYTDDIASTNAWRPSDSRPTHDWCVNFCSEVLGSGFDTQSCVFTLSLDPASAWFIGTAQQTSDDSGLTVVDGGADDGTADAEYDQAA